MPRALRPASSKAPVRELAAVLGVGAALLLAGGPTTSGKSAAASRALGGKGLDANRPLSHDVEDTRNDRSDCLAAQP